MLFCCAHRAVELKRLRHLGQRHVRGRQHGVELHVDEQEGRQLPDRRVTVAGVGQQLDEEHLGRQHGERGRAWQG